MIPVDMEWDDRKGWTFLVPQKLSPKAFNEALRKVYEFYKAMIRDLRTHEQFSCAEDVEKAIQDLHSRRVRQVIRPKPGAMEIQL